MPDDCDSACDGRGESDGAFFLLESPTEESWALGSTQCSNTRMFTIGSGLGGQDSECGVIKRPMDKVNLYGPRNQFYSSEFFQGSSARLLLLIGVCTRTGTQDSLGSELVLDSNSGGRAGDRTLANVPPSRPPGECGARSG
jgi:hypothetical protein